jgi:hypothetical protein
VSRCHLRHLCHLRPSSNSYHHTKVLISIINLKIVISDSI